ncbi:hypothetical protein ACSBOB_27380 [Mesorhizobium sp. ASY16-5R]|uniref:hypothetical protein n=1 Tax=Mesorhizobium sp. ASY16-5R TaxID=3445772 RepID=UPI003FA05492
MDWTAAVDKNREALKRVLAMLVAMAGMGAGLGAGGQFPFFPQKGAAASGLALAEKSKLSPALTLPRNLHRAIAKLLRPAEAAVRRLIIVAARGVVVVLPPARPRKSTPKPIEPLLRGFGIAVTVSRDELRRIAATRRAAEIRAARPKKRSLPLFDPLRPWSVRPWPVAADGAPSGMPFRRRSANDPVDATRISLRLQALAAALDDLPGQARRFARWRARNAAAAAKEKLRQEARIAPFRRTGKSVRARRVWPLKPGRPPGWRPKSTHEVQDVLEVVHGLAQWAMEKPNTS